VTIDADGNVTYDGTRFVRVEGRRTDRIPVARVAAILDAADRIHFFDLRDQYRTIQNPDGTVSMVTDQPTTYVTIARDGRTKRIEDYYGAPKELRGLETQIDDAARTNRWIRIDAETLQQMLQDGWFPSVEESAALLRIALGHDELPVIEGLLDLGADSNATYYGTKTLPLMMVRSAAAAKLLLAAGASPFQRSDNGYTPLWWATHLEPGVAEALLKAGARPDDPADRYGATALWYAACDGNAGVVSLLLNAGADAAATHNSRSAVDCAKEAREGERKRGRSSLETGEPPYARDFDRTIALLEEALAKRRR